MTSVEAAEDISKPPKDKKVMRTSQHRFPKSKSSFANQITFSDKMTGYVGEGRLVGIIYLTLVKHLTLPPTVSQISLRS